MENASKALLMATGILIGVLILTLIATLYISSKEMFDRYDETKTSEAIQQFNVNFTKYLGKELSIHEVVTICNFATKNNVSIEGGKEAKDIKDIVENYTNDPNSIERYELEIIEWDKGYVKKIKID